MLYIIWHIRFLSCVSEKKQNIKLYRIWVNSKVNNIVELATVLSQTVHCACTRLKQQKSQMFGLYLFFSQAKRKRLCSWKHTQNTLEWSRNGYIQNIGSNVNRPFVYLHPKALQSEYWSEAALVFVFSQLEQNDIKSLFPPQAPLNTWSDAWGAIEKKHLAFILFSTHFSLV